MLYTVIYESLNLIPLIEQPWPDTLKLSISDGVANIFVGLNISFTHVVCGF